MSSLSRHPEIHRTDRIGWLRAAVMGANDGVVSTASLLVGVAAAQTSHATLLLTGLAGLVAGAMSMAAGEYVSVHSQADTEAADLAREREELAEDRPAEHRELAGIYVARGLTPALAAQVAEQLMAHDALGSHARDELGIQDGGSARPLQAALASGTSFAVGAALPVIVAAVSPTRSLAWAIGGTAVIALAGLGALAAHAGGARRMKGAMRVALWGALAMAATAVAGSLFNAAI